MLLKTIVFVNRMQFTKTTAIIGCIQHNKQNDYLPHLELIDTPTTNLRFAN